MTIWFNMTTTYYWKMPASGIPRVERNLYTELKKLYGDELQCCIWNNGAFINIDESATYQNHIEILPNFEGSSLFHEKNCFQKNDIFFTAGGEWNFDYSQKLYFLKQRYHLKILSMCHDLVPILYQHYACVDKDLFTQTLIYMAENSDCIVCNSQNTQRDLQEFLYHTGSATPKISVIRLGDTLPVYQAYQHVSEKIQDIINLNFILYVSTIEPRKNHRVLLHAYHILRSQNKSNNALPKMVFVGSVGWDANQLMKEIQDNPLIKNDIIMLSGLNDTELYMLYQKALFCVYPSFYEGWGLPIGEALALGKGVLASDVASIPEIGGELVHYLDPYNAREWANAIEKYAQDHKLVVEKEQQVQQHYQQYQWKNTALAIQKHIDE